jgi:leucyl aminopeptidase (aminopeptidase T)
MVLAITIIAGLAAVLAAETAKGEGGDVDYEVLAEKLVTQCAGIHEGDLVRISGGVRDIELLENLAVNVRKLGAFPLVTLSSDRMTRRMYDDVPDEYDAQTSDFGVILAGIISARIHVDFSKSDNVLGGIPAERIVAVSRANAPAWDLMLKRKVRQIYLGNDLYPTAERARLYRVPPEKLAKVFWDGVNVDYEQLQATGEALRAALLDGKEVYVTHPDGTDLKVSIEDRRILVSDGVISADDMKRGNAGCLVWLPAGEVYVSPVPGSAEGVVVVDRQFFQGKEIRGLKLTFKGGRLVSMTAKSGLAPLKEMYDAQGPGKDVFSVIDFGINPNVHVIPGSRMVAWMPAGMVTVGIGDNTWAGGENNSPFEFYNHLSGATVTVNGKVIVENGVLKP